MIGRRQHSQRIDLLHSSSSCGWAARPRGEHGRSPLRRSPVRAPDASGGSSGGSQKNRAKRRNRCIWSGLWTLARARGPGRRRTCRAKENPPKHDVLLLTVPATPRGRCPSGRMRHRRECQRPCKFAVAAQLDPCTARRRIPRDESARCGGAGRGKKGVSGRHEFGENRWPTFCLASGVQSRENRLMRQHDSAPFPREPAVELNRLAQWSPADAD
jgi:hypothetical protein